MHKDASPVSLEQQVQHMLNTVYTAPSTTPAEVGAMPLRDFLAHVGAVFKAGLPSEIWIEATVLAVKAGARGHSLELVDVAPEAGPVAQLTAFMGHRNLAGIRQQLGMALNPAHLAGMTVVVLIAPTFDPRWHVGARLLRIAGSVTESIRQKTVEAVSARLRKEGLFATQSRLRPPADITRLAVIHPPHAQGWGDIEAELLRWQAAGLVRFRSHPCRFEGEGAPDELATAIRTSGEPIDGERPDVVMLVRGGGGGRSGLLALDTEPVARAIGRSCVPVITGVGHAGDITLADQVAWRRADTPSKALGILAEIVGGAARQAESDRAEITRLAGQIVVRAAQTLDLIQEQVARGAQARSAAAASEVEARWAAVRIGATAARGGLDQQAEHLLALIVDTGRATLAMLTSEGNQCQRAKSDIADRAWRALGRANDGTALMSAIGTHNTVQLDRTGPALEQALESVQDSVSRRLAEAEAALTHIAVGLEAHDLGATLSRGFALVLDGEGRAVPDRAAALGQSRLTVRFRDGTLEVRPTDSEQQAERRFCGVQKPLTPREGRTRP